MAEVSPNILVIFNDDHGAWAVGAYGNQDVRTPTIDHLAAGGATMLNAFTPTPVCSPARACFLTGRLTSQHGIHDYLMKRPEYHARGWLKEERTIAEIVDEAGYRSGLCGKWHLGNDETPQAGFRSWFALDGSYPIHHRGEHAYSVDGKVETIRGSKTQIITDRAVKFLREQEREKPFFLFVGYTATHSPWSDHQERLVEQFRTRDLKIGPQVTYPFGRPGNETSLYDHRKWREMLAQYYASIAGIDEGTGRILDELDALGIRDNTLVVYTSDHGLCAGHHGIWGKGNSSVPVNFLEESIRIPLILNGPGIRAGQRRVEFVDHLDSFQTLLDAAGRTPDPARSYAGRSFLPLIRGTAPLLDWRGLQFCEYGNSRMVRTPRHKLVRMGPKGRILLFDLHEDPDESRDLSAEPEMQGLVGRLVAELDGFFGRYEHPERTGHRIHEQPRTNTDEIWI